MHSILSVFANKGLSSIACGYVVRRKEEVASNYFSISIHVAQFPLFGPSFTNFIHNAAGRDLLLHATCMGV